MKSKNNRYNLTGEDIFQDLCFRWSCLYAAEEKTFHCKFAVHGIEEIIESFISLICEG